MSALSLLVRLVVLFAVLCVVAGQVASNSSSSSSSSTGSAVLPMSTAIVASNVSSSSSSSSSWAPAGNATDSSSSSTGVAPSGPAPVLLSISGCNSNYTGNSTADQLNNCDGSTGSSLITIMGVNFTGTTTTFKVKIACSSNTYTPIVVSVTPSMAVSYTPAIDKADSGSACTLTVVNADGQQSASGQQLTFRTWSIDLAEAWRWLGMSFMTVIVVVVIIGLLILVGTILCTLACCCGVSLACLNCCRPRTTTVVLSPQSSGYSSME